MTVTRPVAASTAWQDVQVPLKGAPAKVREARWRRCIAGPRERAGPPVRWQTAQAAGEAAGTAG